MTRNDTRPPHALTLEEAATVFAVGFERGLDRSEVRRRRQLYGPNRLREARRKTTWQILAEQFHSVIVWLLAAAAALSSVLGEWTEAAAIVAVLAINSTIGFVTELRAIRSMEALRRLTTVSAKVRRDGKVMVIKADEVVPGDIVLLESGDIVPADLRLVESADLQCDESALTGESVPVAKNITPVAADTILAERTAMAFNGTAIMLGSGAGIAVATGMATELGRISALAETAEPEFSPLERRLARLGAQLVVATLALTVLIAMLGVVTGKDLLTMAKTAVALAVAAVPEGLPIVTTVALARGMWRMAQRNALIERLSAVETLGATTVILTDKTGTLTENRMTVVRVSLCDREFDIKPGSIGQGAVLIDHGTAVDPHTQPAFVSALQVGVLCNNAVLSDADDNGQAAQGIGDPMEFALLSAGRQFNIIRSSLLRDMPECREQAFNPATKMMATFHQKADGYMVAVKGAPEAVIAHSESILTPRGPEALDDAGRKDWLRRNDQIADQGLRVLALATKTVQSRNDDPYAGLTLIGLVGLLDPARPDVAAAIAACHGAGVRVVMLTGDHARTAKTIASEVGLATNDEAVTIEAGELRNLHDLSDRERQQVLAADVFARIDPKTKLDLVSLYQEAGHVVAMTGDGVNDAPALKKADIGIAMGQRGTAVAREAADMVLRDDAFPSIVAAMEQGRVIFSNIRKIVVYLISCNLSEILVIGVATLSGLPLPLLPLQILYLNLVTDVFPAFALGVSEGEPGLMRRPPRDPRESIIRTRDWAIISFYGALITAATLGVFTIALGALAMTERDAVTVSFLTLALAQLWHVFNMRRIGTSPLRNELTRNPFLWGALALCLMLIAAAIYLPGLATLLGLAPPDMMGWSLAFCASLVPLLIGEGVRGLFALRKSI